jgi:uncharacterized LabA/DUF88 family protein
MSSAVKPLTSQPVRVACFIDGFNLYHAIDDIGIAKLKWVNLDGLMRAFISPARHRIVSIYYFSAYAEWLVGACARHKAFVAANQHYGVTPVLGNFKALPASCNVCNTRWTRHEEKQTDVNIAVAIVREAFKDSYDEAFLVSGDSDLAPALSLVREIAPQKKIKLLSPPGRKHSKELGQHATKLVAIDQIHLERNLMPRQIIDGTGAVLATRPVKYAP